jgi:hypothetical protein
MTGLFKARLTILPGMTGSLERGRGEQGEMMRQTHFVLALYVCATILGEGISRSGQTALPSSFTHKRAQTNTRTDTRLSLLTTASQARHAPESGCGQV